MAFPLRALPLLLLATLSTASSWCQSGTPAPMAPIANPDPRLATVRTGQGRVRQPGGLAISPDGTQLAWSTGGREGGILHLNSATNPDPAKEKLIAPNADTACSNGSPVWAPDSKSLAYTSSCTGKDAKPGQSQIFLYSVADGTSKQLTHVTGLFQQAAFAPDGSALAFLFVENATRSAGALAAMKPWSGVIGEDGVEIQRVAQVSVPNGEFHFLTQPNLHIYEFAWAPFSGAITFIAANPPGENNWWVAKLYTLSLGHMEQHVLIDPATTTSGLKGLQLAVPRYSPDGKQIAVIGGLMSDQGSTGGDIWVVKTETPNGKPHEPTDVTPNIDGTPTYLAWTGPDNIGFVEDRRGHNLLVDYTVSTHKQDAVNDLGEVTVSGGPISHAIAVSNTGTLAYVKSGHALAPEIWVGTFAAARQYSHLNDSAKPGNRTESIEWTNDKFQVQGWLTYPVDYDAKKKYPLIVNVHGGPSASAGAPFGTNTWAQLGYFVFAPNPRGSFGQGEAFTAANRRDFGYGDLRDILAGMDAVEKKVSIDTKREGLTGWSYGGFMTMFAVTQTHRFRAAVAGAGLSNWQSYYGENSIDQWMVPFFGATVYDDPAIYAKSSAITFIKNVTTPTLVIVGDRDGECPAPQSFEFWHALRAQGTKTQLVVYPNEGHGFRDPAHIRDREERMAAWFSENMPAQ